MDDLHLARFFHLSPDLLCVAGLDGFFKAVNASWEGVFGWTVGELKTRPFVDFIHPEDRTRTLEEAGRITSGRSAAVFENRYRCRNGEYKWLSWRSFPIAEDGAIYAIARDITETKKEMINTNVTDRKNLDSRLLRIERLESVGTLAAGLAHDVNNILAPVLMAATLLRMNPDPQETEHLLSNVESCALRGADMMNHLLAFARGTEGQRVPLMLGTLLKELRKLVHATFPKDIDIESSSPQRLWPIVGDHTQLHQVLLNLCVNARDAMPNGGRLRISATNAELDEDFVRTAPDLQAGHYCVISIEDTGAGIDPSVMDKIFDPFFTTKESGKGTGLGLSSALGIVRSHGGALHVSSEPGIGSVFKVFLPARPEVAAVAERLEPARLQRGNQELILVADDDEILRKTIRAILERFNYRVMEAADGTEALVALAAHRSAIRLLLTDMMMPNLDGMALIRASRKLMPGLSVVGCSGLEVNPVQNTGAPGEEMHAFLSKPFTAEQLLDAIESAIHVPPPGERI